MVCPCWVMNASVARRCSGACPTKSSVPPWLRAWPLSWHRPMSSFAEPTTALPSRHVSRSVHLANSTARSSPATSWAWSALRRDSMASKRCWPSWLDAAERAELTRRTPRKFIANMKPRPSDSSQLASTHPAFMVMTTLGKRGPQMYPKMFLTVISVPDAKVRLSTGTTWTLMPHRAATQAFCAANTQNEQAHVSQSHTSPRSPADSLECCLP
mmetsp:Transcript_14105/g.41143  ORF Transcript_14105/g.41143 Transcript_14105/m.41143 type:complete len:213 (-) Transcript_14105:233-871(-)